MGDGRRRLAAVLGEPVDDQGRAQQRASWATAGRRAGAAAGVMGDGRWRLAAVLGEPVDDQGRAQQRASWATAGRRAGAAAGVMGDGRRRAGAAAGVNVARRQVSALPATGRTAAVPWACASAQSARPLPAATGATS